MLWSKTFVKIKGKDPVAELVDVLLEEKAGSSACTVGNSALKWTRLNKNGIEFFVVVVYSSVLTLAYVDDLLEAMKSGFFRRYEEELKDVKNVSFEYDEEFDIILRAAEAKNSASKKNKQSAVQVTRHSSHVVFKL